MLKLNLGCGNVYLNGWINIDCDSKKADLNMDLRNPLPYQDNTIDFIYSEHVIEHFTVKEGLALLKECYRVLKPGGIIRIATPDLNYTMFRYYFFWRNQSWYKQFGYQWIKTKAEMINICFREWGHQYLYNKEELKRRIQEAGFNKIYQVKHSRSNYTELKHLETRKESNLIIEAVK